MSAKIHGIDGDISDKPWIFDADSGTKARGIIRWYPVTDERNPLWPRVADFTNREGEK